MYKCTEKCLTLLAATTSRAARRNVQRDTRFTKKLFSTKQNAIIKEHLTHNRPAVVPKIKYLGFNRNYQATSKTSANILNYPIANPEKPIAYSNPLPDLKLPLTHPRFARDKSGKNDIQSVTRILSATMPAASLYALEKWKEGMIAKLGAAGFAKYQAETFERGRVIHQIVADYLLGKGEPVSNDNRLSNKVVLNLWKSIRHVVCEKITDPRLVEHIVTHKDMNYRGIVDCVACYDGQLSVIDFKTAEKKKSANDLYDNPLQVSAYCGALNNDTSIPNHVVDRNILTGLVIVAYVDGSEADLYFFNKEQINDKYWKKWLVRLDQFFKLPSAVKN